MGVTKTTLFSEKQNQMALMAKVFAHPARIAILEHLVKTNACINGDLVAELGLAQATISQHLKELKLLGLIRGTVEGTSMSYCINGAVWKNVHQAFDELFSGYKGDHCC